MDPQTYFHFLPVWVVGNFLTTKREKIVRRELFLQCSCEQMYNSLASDCPRAPASFSPRYSGPGLVFCTGGAQLVPRTVQR